LAARAFKRGEAFPNEDFVQGAIERHFAELGFKLLSGTHADLECEHPTSRERWLVEAKGLTSAVGLDFRTGLGQLLQRMHEPSTHYGVAVPDIPQFRSQCAQVSPRVRELLGVHWLFVTSEGLVRVVGPTEQLE